MNSLYQFENPARESIIHNIDACVLPPLVGTNPPGAVHLFNMVDKLNELYARYKERVVEIDAAKGQRFLWLAEAKKDD
ncbi:hypothetical protein SCLCIDRAFT_24434 [Scleroderma citrinum Foug A]|uniref:Uncharacterized protein n=1 Tax=Scleroderma citrinum Foug A TaxID=1036808 RepID=A0A0C3E4A8_9AGAM|nr:hypothetical protein SCLCIDRAFT_24434 [Scleroderma citrinum Foug A]